MQTSQAEVTQQSQQKYVISGSVDFSTSPDLLRQSTGFLSALKANDNKQVTMDMSQVEACNSAALALMLEIAKSAEQNKIELHFENIPAAVSTIAKAYGVENEIRELCK